MIHSWAMGISRGSYYRLETAIVTREACVDDTHISCGKSWITILLVVFGSCI